MPGIVEYSCRYPATALNALFVDRVVNSLEDGVELRFASRNSPICRTGRYEWVQVGRYCVSHQSIWQIDT